VRNPGAMPDGWRMPSGGGDRQDGRHGPRAGGQPTGIGYALRLLQAGVPVELHPWPGTFHGSQAILSAEISQRQLAELTAALRRAVAD
jgi:acetyl esterase/lipase